MLTAVQLQPRWSLCCTARSGRASPKMGVCSGLAWLGISLALSYAEDRTLGVSLTSVMVVVVSLLVLMDRRSQAAKRIMLEEYYREQAG